MKKIFSIILFTCSLQSFSQKFDGVALTPPMGWNSWNTFQTRLSEELVKQTADMLVSSGMKDMGYTYLVLDDGWSARQRDSLTGNLVADPVKFPNGMKAVADYVHSKGLKFGLYNCGGVRTCADFPGSYGYEEMDARLYASWGIDYLKYDWCYSEGLDAVASYKRMSQAIRNAGRPMIFSLCEWGITKPWLWAKEVGHLWRTTGDIGSVFNGMKNHGTWSSNGVMTIVDLQVGLREYTGSGHWNDPDMLEVGNGMSYQEDRAHFSLWCMLAAPLMAGNDLRKMNKTTLDILTNSDAIAIDQDKLGIAGLRYSNTDSLQVWVKPLENDEWAVCFVNRSAKEKKITFDWSKEVIKDRLTGRQLGGTGSQYKLFDIWKKSIVGNTAEVLSKAIASHDVLFLRLKK